MIRIAIVGTGNIGQAAQKAVQNAEDMELVGVYHHYEVDDAQCTMHNVDVALVCLPTRESPAFAEKMLRMGISTVDSFDIHTQIPAVRSRLMPVAQSNHAVAVISAGWDPGSDSMIRALLQVLTPEGQSYTNFGPGRSMGHTVAAKAIAGVKNALSITLPLGKGQHGRHVYIELEDGYDFEDVRNRLLADDYFAHDATEVELVDDVEQYQTTAHGVLLERTGTASGKDGQQLEFKMQIDNPSLTAQFMTGCARAAYRLQQTGRWGCYTTIELAPVDMLPGTTESNVQHLV
ncbi:MAG: diaminopimelate dehydrogenase [Paludibacteraceae bacterium]|nr:diaminopimelate dehydrogenase [Paludibacteraceae bacterium]